MQDPAPGIYDFNIYYLSEQAITIEFGKEISDNLLEQISSVSELINQNPFTGLCATVPAYSTLSIFFDPVQVSQCTDLTGNDCFEKVSNYVKNLQTQKNPASQTTNTTIDIPVCYGGSYGPDLEEVARVHALSLQEVIALHSTAVYKVYMIGFVPGFAYLGGMSELLSTPRKATPRKSIPAGSVGIAGKQTGIYPLQTPGGWQLIGRTPLNLFDPNRTQPALLKAGDHIVFKPIHHSEFELYSKQQNADTHN